jgi:PAS domain S-box-containing protein
MLEEIESDYAHVVTLRTMSAMIGRQPAYLGRLFHQEVGSSVRDHLTRVRLEHAAELIRDGVKIEAVALSVGYRSKKNFYQRFKTHFGTTPVLYRTGCVAKHSEPECRTALEHRSRAAVPSPEHHWFNEGEVSPSEPVLSRLTSIVRASNKAWRLAARAQEIMLQHFTRLRVGILLTNDAGRYVAANRAAAAATGYSTTELCDRSPGDLFASMPGTETRCVWQLMLLHSNQPPNSMIRTKAGDCVGVHVVTLKNVLWGRREWYTPDGSLRIMTS